MWNSNYRIREDKKAKTKIGNGRRRDGEERKRKE